MAISTLALRGPISKKRSILVRGRKYKRSMPLLTLRKLNQRFVQGKILARGAQKMRGMFRSPAKTLKLSKINNNNRKRLQGFQITRSVMINMGQNNTSASTYLDGVVDPWNTTSLEFHGAGIPFITRIETARNWTLDQGNPSNSGSVNAFHEGTTCVVFTPQWPGSKADRDGCLTDLGKTGTKIKPNFGVKPNHQKLPDASQKDNYQFNNVCVSGMHGLFENSTDTTQLVNETFTFTGNVLNVMNSYCTIELFNPNPRAPVDVHIFTVFQKTKQYQDKTGSCSSQLNLNQFLYELGHAGPWEQHNAYSTTLIDQVRKGKLPSKLFKVLKHRVCHLGCRPNSSVTSPNYQQNGPSTNRKVVKMKFAGKKFFRQYCTTQTDLFDASVTLEENYNSIQKVIMVALPTQTAALTSTEFATTLPSTTIYPVWYKINKTNIWTVQGNY